MGEGSCVDEQFLVLSSVSFENSNDAECRELCTSVQDCIGYVYFELSNEKCILYGFTDSSFVSKCDFVSCSVLTGSSGQIAGTKQAPPWLSCYKKVTRKHFFIIFL